MAPRASAKLNAMAIKTVFLPGTYLLGITPSVTPLSGNDVFGSVKEDPHQAAKLILIIWCSIRFKCFAISVAAINSR